MSNIRLLKSRGVSNWVIWFLLLMYSVAAHAGSSEPYELKASVKYSIAADRYVLVYSSNEISSGPNIYGRILRVDGTPAAGDFRLSTQTGKMTKPVLAYSEKAQRFLVVWGRKDFGEPRAEIVGVSLSADGGLIQQEFRISTSMLYDQRPAIAYCPGRDRFLVTWSRGVQYDVENGDSDVYGQFVGGDASQLQGSNFLIATGAKNQFKQDVDCDPLNDRFLVVWGDQRQASVKDDIYGQLIASDGAMLGGNFLIASTPHIERRPTVAANTRTGNYLVVWESEAEGVPIRLFSQLIDPNGKLVGAQTEVGADLGGGRNRPALAFLKKQNVFLVAFDNSAFDDVPDGIFGQFFEPGGELRQRAFPLTTAKQGQYRPDVAASQSSFLTVWTDYRTTEVAGGVYEYFGRVIGNDAALTARKKNPESR